MPAIALASLALMVALPTLSSVRLYAATAQHYATVTVRPGDTLWAIAAAHAGSSADVQVGRPHRRRQPPKDRQHPTGPTAKNSPIAKKP